MVDSIGGRDILVDTILLFQAKTKESSNRGTFTWNSAGNNYIHHRNSVNSLWIWNGMGNLPILDSMGPISIGNSISNNCRINEIAWNSLWVCKG